MTGTAFPTAFPTAAPPARLPSLLQPPSQTPVLSREVGRRTWRLQHHPTRWLQPYPTPYTDGLPRRPAPTAAPRTVCPPPFLQPQLLTPVIARDGWYRAVRLQASIVAWLL